VLTAADVGRSGRDVGVAALIVLVAAVVWAQGGPWKIPPDAGDLTNPKAVTPEMIKTGKGVFGSRCQKCHGAEGTGRGPQSDPKHPAADLTRSRASLNPDGVLFYKVWNGGAPMPAFKSELSRDEVWAVVEYVKTLRQE
jgi:mono/diheme cytochrome c family protein